MATSVKLNYAKIARASKESSPSITSSTSSLQSPRSEKSVVSPSSDEKKGKTMRHVTGDANSAYADVANLLKTDEEITTSGLKASISRRERDLKPWNPEAQDNALRDFSLESKYSSSYHTTFDQFEANRRLFGVEPSFDESHYTTKLDKSHPEWRARELRAMKLAKEIEASTTNNPHLAEERNQKDLNDDENDIVRDEESRYGAVVMARAPNTYIPPALRKKSIEESMIPSASVSTVDTSVLATDAQLATNKQKDEAQSKPLITRTSNDTQEDEKPLEKVDSQPLEDPESDIKNRILSFKLNPNAPAFEPSTKGPSSIGPSQQGGQMPYYSQQGRPRYQHQSRPPSSAYPYMGGHYNMQSQGMYSAPFSYSQQQSYPIHGGGYRAHPTQYVNGPLPSAAPSLYPQQQYPANYYPQAGPYYQANRFLPYQYQYPGNYQQHNRSGYRDHQQRQQLGENNSQPANESPNETPTPSTSSENQSSALENKQ